MRRKLPAYLTKLTIYSVLLGLLPTLIVGAVSYAIAFRSLRAEVNKGSVQSLVEAQNRVEQQLKMLDQSVSEFINSTGVQAMQTPIAQRDYDTVNTMYKGMNRVTYDLGIQDVTMVSFRHKWVVSNSYSFHYVDDSRLSQLWLPYLKRPSSSYWLTEPSGARRLQYTDEMTGARVFGSRPFSVAFVKKIPVNSPEPYGVLIADMARTFPDDFIQELYPDKTTVIFDEGGQPLTRSAGPLSFESIRAAMSSDPADAGYFEAEGEAEKLLVSYRRSAYNGWTYVSLASTERILADARRIVWVMLLATLAIVAAVGWIAVHGSRRMYDPVRTLFRSIGEGPPGGADGGDEFAAIGRYMRELSQERIRLGGQLKALTLTKLYRGELEAKELAEKQRTGELQAREAMLVIALQIDTLEGTKYAEADADLLRFALGNIAGELAAAQGLAGPVVLRDTVALLTGADGPAAGLTRLAADLAGRIQEQARQHLLLSVSAGISRPFAELGAVPAAFQESAEALEYRLRFGAGAIIRYADVSAGSSARPRLSGAWEKQALQSLRLADRDGAVEALDRLLAELWDNPHTAREYKALLSHLLLKLLAVPEETSAAGPLEPPSRLLDQLYAVRTKEEMASFFVRQVIEPVVEQVRTQRASQYKKISGDVLAMIEAQYDTDLSLEVCSAALNYHPDYIRRVFKEETGMTFSDCLSQTRLRKAKEWLQETDMRIAELAERLHYHNAQNFIRYFRKAEGVTPGQYRERYRRGAEAAEPPS